MLTNLLFLGESGVFSAVQSSGNNSGGWGILSSRNGGTPGGAIAGQVNGGSYFGEAGWGVVFRPFGTDPIRVTSPSTSTYRGFIEVSESSETIRCYFYNGNRIVAGSFGAATELPRASNETPFGLDRALTGWEISRLEGASGDAVDAVQVAPVAASGDFTTPNNGFSFVVSSNSTVARVTVPANAQSGWHLVKSRTADGFAKQWSFFASMINTGNPPNPYGGCTLAGECQVEDLGGGDYRARAFLTGAQGNARATWLRNGVALAGEGSEGALSALFSLALGESATIAAAITDSAGCQAGIRAIEKNSDVGGGGNTGDLSCPPNHYRKVVGGPCLPIPVTTIPDVPRAPTVAKNCVAGTLDVTTPVFPLGAARLELERENSALVYPPFSAPGTFFDAISDAAAHRYRVRTCNNFGCSEFGPWSASVSLQSAATLAFLTPIADATLSNRVLVRFQITDAGEPRLADCPPFVGSGDCKNSAPNVALLVDGLPSPAILELESGTARNGIYRALLDTRDFASGARNLVARATGTDCCQARIGLAVVFSNSLRAGTLYLQNQYTTAPPRGSVWNQAEISLENGPLEAALTRRYYVKTAVTSNAATLVDWQDAALSPDAKRNAFDSLSPLVLEAAQTSATPTATQICAVAQMAPAGAAIYCVQQWNPVERVSALLTGCERVENIVPDANRPGDYLIFARNRDGSAARLFSLVGSENGFALTRAVDFANQSAAAAKSVAWLGDKIWAMSGNEVIAVDAEFPDITLNAAPRGEQRAPLAVIASNGKMVGVWADGAASPQTRAYDLNLSSPRATWSLDVAASRVAQVGASLMIACDKALYSSVGSDGPVAIRTFSAPITAIGGDESGALVGLQNGEVWRARSGIWTRLTTLMGAVNAVGFWDGNAPAQGEKLAVAGTDSTALSEELIGGAWTDARVLRAPSGGSETITKVTAIARFEKTLAPASGTAGQPGYVPAKTLTALLVGTAPSGVLLVIESLSEAGKRGAFLASRVRHIGMDPYSGLTPL